MKSGSPSKNTRTPLGSEIRFNITLSVNSNSAPSGAVILLSNVIVVELILVTDTPEIGAAGSVDVTFAPTYMSAFSSVSTRTFVFCADCVCPQLWMDPERPNYPNEKGHAVTMFVTGTQAKALFDLPTWKVIQLFLTQLDNMFGTKKNRRPASAAYEDHSICKWDSVAYTYPTHGDPSILCGPINHNSVYFAGEHCGVEASEIATINGAMESGKKAAERVVQEGIRKPKL